VVEKEESARERHMMRSPKMGDQRPWMGNRWSIPITRGALMYIIPIAQVPTRAMLLDPAKGSWVL